MRSAPAFLIATVAATALIAIGFASAAESASSNPRAFDSAIARMIDQSTAVTRSRAELAAARARARSAGLYYLPSISANATNTLSSEQSATSEYRQLELTSNWNLFRFGADRAGAIAADHEESAAEAGLEKALFEAESSAVRATVDLIQRREESSILGRIEEQQSELLRIARERYGRGLLALQEVQKLEVDQENVRSRRREAATLHERAVANVVALLAVEVEPELAKADWPWKSELSRDQGALLTPRAEDDAARRDLPDLKAADASANAARARADRAFRLGLPSLDARFGVGKYYQPRLAIDYSGWVGTVSLTIPIFERLSTTSEATAQAELAQAREAEFEQARRAARRDHASARARFQNARDSAMASERNLQLSRGLFDDGLKRFRAGRIDANGLSFDRSRLSDSELSAVRSWAEAHLAFTEFCHALGRRLNTCLGR